MKKIKYLSAILFIFLAMSCADNFLTQKDLYEKSDESYYSSPEDIDEALAGAYAALPNDAGNNNPFIVAKLMSDDAFGGGGTDDITGFFATDQFTISSPDYYMDLFKTSWPGILRANLILKRFDQVNYTDINRKNQALGETYFLRAFFYFRLSEFFGPVPLKLEPVPENKPRATPEEMYGQIAQDLKTAIEIMPSAKYQDISTSRLGHATKWAAEALMARVFLFYTGYYKQTEIALPDGGTVTKSNVIDWLVDCIDNSGHALLSDFRNLWAYSSDLVKHYPFKDMYNLHWAGEEGGNVETIFAIKYSVNGGWTPPKYTRYCNQHVLYTGMRKNTTVPFGYGWGGGPVNPQLWESFEDGDLRRDGSIVNLINPSPGDDSVAVHYQWNAGNNMQETGFMEKKYMPIFDSLGSRAVSIYFMQYGTPDDNQLWNMQDDIVIRFADVLLMAAELGAPKAQEYLDDVRSRAGLGSVPVNLQNIQNERRHELAFEGLRYFDLLRWGIAEESIEKAKGVAMMDVGIPNTYDVDYRPETGGFLPIPQTEITLSSGVLEQTPGW